MQKDLANGSREMLPVFTHVSQMAIGKLTRL